ncbi:hypothetical protein QU487_07150 [Crenobacter sp. SG2305]|uniref:hypothetical protein n=1 Tax=Crenobacter oryzisoli TaxID=3056844 RepID=UPI0025AAB958|nr:hypothetical protein [Crenobacter sp. SG2305]MDN0082532.1 hypothetical protein [Crenobacter sp. SG2305]
MTLFEHTQQRIRLTRDGRTFLSEARAFLRHASRLESLVRRLGKGDEGGYVSAIWKPRCTQAYCLVH